MNEPRILAASSNGSSLNGMGKTVGASGTSIMKGILTGEEYHLRLQGGEALRIFDIMRRSEEAVRAALQMVKLPLLSLERSIQPASDDELDQYVARFIKHELFEHNLNWYKFSREAMTFFDFGFSVAEKTYEITEFEKKLRIGIKEIGFRKQTSIQGWETEQGRPGITQLLQTPPDGGSGIRSIVRPKLIVWTNDQEGDNYEGISLLRYAFKSWDMLDKLGLVHAIGLEKMAIPTPVLGIPDGANTDDERRAIEAIQQYTSNEKAYIKKPFGWDLEAFDLSGQTLKEMLPALQHYETKILLSVLGQFLMLGANGGSGSRAVSEDHSKLFMLSEEAANKTFQDQVQEDLIKQLCDINFSDLPNGYPRIVSSSVKEDDAKTLAEVVQSLKGASMITPTYETENHLRKVAKLPELPEDYEQDYEKRREMSLTVPEPEDPNANPKPPDPKDPSLEKEKKTEAARRLAHRAQGKLIDVILG